MTWREARDRELAHWSAVCDALGTAAPVDLLTEINAADALCEKAGEESHQTLNPCVRCLVYQQFGGCREVSGRMSERVAAGDREGARALLDGFLAHLRALEISEPETSTAP